MVYHGHVRNGTVVFEGESVPPDGTQVRVEVIEQVEVSADESLSAKLLRFAAKAKGLPPDAARQHDHYLYGTPKQ